MKIAVVGAGGTGGFFGGMLARAGEDVTFIARGAHLEALRARGLRVESASAGDFTIHPASVTDDPKRVGPVDVVLVGVKAWDLDAAAEALRPMVGKSTVVIPLLNGVEAAERLARHLGAGPVLGGVAYIEANIVAPGHVRHSSANLHSLVFGEWRGGPSERAAAVLRTLQKGGFNVQSSTSIQTDVWSKFVFICAASGVCAVTRLPFGVLRAEPATRDLMEAAMREVAAVAGARGVALPANLVQAQMDKVGLLPAAARSSMAKDLERGGRLEVEALNGAVVRMGAQHSVPTPVNGFLYACLKPHASGATDARPAAPS